MPIQFVSFPSYTNSNSNLYYEIVITGPLLDPCFSYNTTQEKIEQNKTPQLTTTYKISNITNLNELKSFFLHVNIIIMRINLLDIDITTVHMLFKPMEFD